MADFTSGNDLHKILYHLQMANTGSNNLLMTYNIRFKAVVQEYNTRRLVSNERINHLFSEIRGLIHKASTQE